MHICDEVPTGSVCSVCWSHSVSQYHKITFLNLSSGSINLVCLGILNSFFSAFGVLLKWAHFYRQGPSGSSYWKTISLLSCVYFISLILDLLSSERGKLGLRKRKKKKTLHRALRLFLPDCSFSTICLYPCFVCGCYYYSILESKTWGCFRGKGGTSSFWSGDLACKTAGQSLTVETGDRYSRSRSFWSFQAGRPSVLVFPLEPLTEKFTLCFCSSAMYRKERRDRSSVDGISNCSHYNTINGLLCCLIRRTLAES